MPPDDLPIETPQQDSTKSPTTKPSLNQDPSFKKGIGPEGEVRGGAERADDLPLEQQRRNETP
jgi:hypothetical protein